MSKSIIIVGRNCAISRCVYDQAERKKMFIDYSSVVPSTTVGATRINALAVVNRTLTQIQEKLAAPGAVAGEPTTIYTLGIVTDMIHNGTFKFWLANDGHKKDGSAVDPMEMELWREFSELYSALYNNICFKDVAKLKIQERPKYPISTEQRVLFQVLEETWKRVGSGVEEIESAEGEDF